MPTQWKVEKAASTPLSLSERPTRNPKPMSIGDAHTEPQPQSNDPTHVDGATGRRNTTADSKEADENKNEKIPRKSPSRLEPTEKEQTEISILTVSEPSQPVEVLAPEEACSFDPDELGAGARVLVLGKRDGKPWQATVRRRHTKKGAPGFMIHYDGRNKKLEDWAPNASVVNFITVGNEIIDDVAKVVRVPLPHREDQQWTERRNVGRKSKKRKVADATQPLTKEERWERNYRELEKFRQEKGHCYVPRNVNLKDGTIPLYNWVNNQRIAYNDNNGTLPGNRVARLEEIGFPWKLRIGSIITKGLSQEQQLWEKNFRGLTKFRAEEGHCNVPRIQRTQKFKSREEISLGNWVRTQRTTYRLKKGALPWNRVARLEGIGFVWRPSEGKAAAARAAASAKPGPPAQNGSTATTPVATAKRKGGDAAPNPATKSTGRSMTTNQSEDAASLSISSGQKTTDRTEMVSAIDFVLSNPNFDTNDIDSFKKDMWELTQNLLRKKRDHIHDE